jgi:hypothetical protein
LGVTSEHAFFVRRKNHHTHSGEWLQTSQLRSGDEIRLANGRWAKVIFVRPKGEARVYNFTVENNHNYFVGNLRLLTHNAGCVTDALKEFGLQSGPGRSKDILQVAGDADDATMVFNRLRDGNKVTRVGVQSSGDGVWVSESANVPGKQVTFRYASKTGPPTVNVPGLEAGIRKLKFIN